MFSSDAPVSAVHEELEEAKKRGNLSGRGALEGLEGLVKIDEETPMENAWFSAGKIMENPIEMDDDLG